MHAATRISTAHSRMITLTRRTTTVDAINVDGVPVSARVSGLLALTRADSRISESDVHVHGYMLDVPSI